MFASPPEQSEAGLWATCLRSPGLAGSFGRSEVPGFLGEQSPSSLPQATGTGFSLEGDHVLLSQWHQPGLRLDTFSLLLCPVGTDISPLSLAPCLY